MKFRDQADAIEQLCMKVFGAKPEYSQPDEFRYFQRGETVWKMPPNGLGYIRDATEKFWEGSICDLSDMLHNDGIAKYPEISAEEGEP
jgi:hypothetical protein